jgi:hypothetical protein
VLRRSLCGYSMLRQISLVRMRVRARVVVLRTENESIFRYGSGLGS